MSTPFSFQVQPRHSQRGVTLIEALLSFLVLAVGVLSMSKLHHHLQSQADLARQRSEAVRIAQEDIESERAYASLSDTSDAPSYASIATVTSSIEELNGQRLHTSFQLTRQVDDGSVLRLKSATVSVAWTARDGSAQQAIVNSAIAGQSPALAGALTLGPSAGSPSGTYARSTRIPVVAKNLGDGRSALKPSAAGTVAFVFDNLSGQVTQRCNDVASDISTAQLTAANLTRCIDAHGLLLSGTVRFSNASPPDPVVANDPPLDLAISVALPSSVETASPWCDVEALKSVLYRTAEGIHREVVPLADTPASFGVSDWTDLGERFVSYQCLVPAAGTPARWSGRSNVVPLGWTIGTTATDQRICRYAWDHDGSGAIDRNDEHPAVYSGVDRALTQQNFLVIRGDQACPVDAGTRMDAVDGVLSTRVATVQHQP